MQSRILIVCVVLTFGCASSPKHDYDAYIKRREDHYNSMGVDWTPMDKIVYQSDEFEKEPPHRWCHFEIKESLTTRLTLVKTCLDIP